MIQEILTYIIISLASIYTIVNTYKFFIPGKKNRTGACSGCAKGSCGGCNIYAQTAGKITPQKIRLQ